MKSRQTIIIGVSSGIAGYKVIDLIKLLRQEGKEVVVVMTENAVKMFGKSDFEKVSGQRVYSKIIEDNFDYKKILEKKTVDHIDLAEKSDLFVVVPATANVIAKIAHGFADDFLTTSILATNAPVLICPSMNTRMWKNSAVVHNIEILQKRGYYILNPVIGLLACDTFGMGKLPKVEDIADEIFKILKNKNKLKGKKIMVTAGGTREAIDTVRVISNRASGKMGIAIAEEAYLRGAEVFLIRARNSVKSPYPIREVFFETLKDLENLIRKNIKDYDYIFHTAAVSDFLPERSFKIKIDSSQNLNIKFKKAAKILHLLKNWNPKITVVGFKAVYREKRESFMEIGMKKLKESETDFMAVNDVGKEGIGFEADENEVYLLSREGLVAHIKKSPKREVARQMLEQIFKG